MDSSPKTNERSSFIPFELDDYGLSASQFRVFCHISRRGQCFSSLETMASICRLHRDTVCACLNELVSFGMVRRTPKPGKTTDFTVTPISQWNPPETKGQPHRKRRGDTHRNAGGDYPPETKGHKGSPSEVTPSEGSPINGKPAPIRTMMDAKDVIAFCDARLNAMRTDGKLFEGWDGFTHEPELKPEAQAEWDQLVQRKREAGQAISGTMPTKDFAEKQSETPKRLNDRNRGSLNEGKSSQYADIGKVLDRPSPEKGAEQAPPAIQERASEAQSVAPDFAGLKAQIASTPAPPSARRIRPHEAPPLYPGAIPNNGF